MKLTFPKILFLFIPFLFFSCKKEKSRLPLVTTLNVAQKSNCTCGGVVYFEGDAKVTGRGVCWSTAAEPEIDGNKTEDGEGEGNFTSILTGLKVGQLIHVRAYATNEFGTSYGEEKVFLANGTTTTNPSSGNNSLMDIDGTIYKTVTIGTQVWMAENLKVRTFRNGDPIPYVNTDFSWSSAAIGGYCYYEHNNSLYQTYGNLYNWFAVTDPRQLAPAGWHVPSLAEFDVLVKYLGGTVIAGNKLKSSGNTNWINSSGADNSSGFTALPGGYRVSTFGAIYTGAYFWTTTFTSTLANYCVLAGTNTNVGYGNGNFYYGFSVRLVKD